MADTATIPAEVATAIAAMFQQDPAASDAPPYVLTVNGVKVRITGTTLEVIP